MTLEVSAEVREGMLEHAREGAPEEVVGVLAGRRDVAMDDDTGEAHSTVERRYPAENVADSPRTRYEIAPAAELRLLERVDADGLDVVGFYHSHPDGPAEPSRTDARLAAWSGYSYVIVSLAGDEPALGSWRWTGETFREESVRTR